MRRDRSFARLRSWRYLVIGYGRRGDHCQQPDRRYGHVHGAPFVLRGASDDHPVPVDRDHRDGAHRYHDVGSLQQWHELAERRAHCPLVLQDRRQRERHAHQAQRDVGYGEVDDVQVPGRVHLGTSGHNVHHGQVGRQPDEHEAQVQDYQQRLGGGEANKKRILNKNNASFPAKSTRK